MLVIVFEEWWYIVHLWTALSSSEDGLVVRLVLAVMLRMEEDTWHTCPSVPATSAGQPRLQHHHDKFSVEEWSQRSLDVIQGDSIIILPHCQRL